MSIRNLDAVFRPGALALIGASKTPGSIGAVVARNLFNAGFDGPVMPVNPKHRSIEGVLAYPSVAQLPVVPDLALICTPPDTVPGLVAELGARGCRGAIVISAGFGELGSVRGKALEAATLAAAKPHLLRLIGPNCLGVLVPGVGLNASFAPLTPAKGDLAFVAQSGAMVTAVIDWAQPRAIGFSHLVSLGDMVDVDFGDMLDYLASDPATRAILLYVEAITQARKFMSAARAAARLKPVIVLKAGRHAESARAAASHTGALAGDDAAYDAAFRRAGMLRVFDLDEVFDAVETLATAPPIAGDRLAILTNGGGIGVIAADSLLDRGGRLATLSADTLRALDGVLPATWSRGDPVDIIGDATGERYRAAMAPLLKAPEIDALLVLNCPTAVASSEDAARAVIEACATRTKPVLTSWVGDVAARPARALFARHRIASYDTPDKAVRGFMHLVNYRRNQDLLMQVPPMAAIEGACDPDAARAVIAAALAEGRVSLTGPESKRVLAAYAIPVARAAIARDAGAAAAIARGFAGRVALKILSPDISHKSDVGGVVLDLAAGDVEAAAREMAERISRVLPKARLDGFTVEEMIHRPGAHELIIGMNDDATFGPVVLFGQGGVGVEVVRDTAMALPPLNQPLARELIERTRIARLLRGYRDRAPVDLAAIEAILIRVGRMASELDEMVELDINPLLADSRGVIALDARIAVRERGQRRGAARFAIRPYPAELATTLDINGLGRLGLRPVRPEDWPAFAEAFKRLSPEDVRLRFFAPMRQLGRDMLVRLTQIDYDREMAFVLERLDAPFNGEIIGVVRLAADPDNRRAEFAVVVRSDLKGRGLGARLMRHLIEYARARGTGEIFGDMLRENAAMVALCRKLGFVIADLPEGHDILRASLSLARG